MRTPPSHLRALIAIGRKVLAMLGFGQDEIENTETAFRRRDEDRLDRQIDVDDLMAGKDDLYEQGAGV